jgi:hypothetical protein
MGDSKHKPISLAPLSPEEALRRAMKAPPAKTDSSASKATPAKKKATKKK